MTRAPSSYLIRQMFYSTSLPLVLCRMYLWYLSILFVIEERNSLVIRLKLVEWKPEIVILIRSELQVSFSNSLHFSDENFCWFLISEYLFCTLFSTAFSISFWTHFSTSYNIRINIVHNVTIHHQTCTSSLLASTSIGAPSSALSSFFKSDSPFIISKLLDFEEVYSSSLTLTNVSSGLTS